MEKQYVVGMAGGERGWASFDVTMGGLHISSCRRQQATRLKRALAQCVAGLLSYAYPNEKVIIEEES